MLTFGYTTSQTAELEKVQTIENDTDSESSADKGHIIHMHTGAACASVFFSVHEDYLILVFSFLCIFLSSGMLLFNLGVNFGFITVSSLFFHLYPYFHPKQGILNPKDKCVFRAENSDWDAILPIGRFTDYPSKMVIRSGNR